LWIIWVITYILVGSSICFLFSMVDDGYFDGYEDWGTIIAVLTGALWPVVAPFSFAILYARKKKEGK